jgi:hypothetical protein
VTGHRVFRSDLLDQLVEFGLGLGADAKGVMNGITKYGNFDGDY